MLQLLGAAVGLLIIIVCFTKGLQEGGKAKKSQPLESAANNNKSPMNDLSEEDLHLLTKILSIGLVDADPDYLHHLKGYRDLQSG